jgi:4-amino-4-deoxy-L-arabinose transferase-like glycosyltransferase
MHLRENPFPLLLVGLILFLSSVTAVWVSIDRRPPQWDHANHLERALHCRNILTGPAGDRFVKVMEMSSFYPPLVPCAAGILYLFSPVTPLTSQAVMLIFLAGALVSLYLLGRSLFDPPTGFFAALIFGTAPFVVFSTTNFQLDLPLAAMVIATILALGTTEGFSRRGSSWAAGVLLALGLLTKPPFVIYVLPVLGLTIWKMFRSGDRRRRLGNLGAALLIPAALALPWYGPRLFALPMQVMNRSFKQAAESGYPDALTAFSLLFYPRTFLPQFGLLAAFLFLLGAWALRHDRRARGVLLGSFFIPFVVFLFLQNKNLRYTLPLLPVAALIAAAGLRGLTPPWRRLFLAGCVIVSLLQVGAAAFGTPPVPHWSIFHLPLVMTDPPNGAEWPHGRILALIVERAGGRPITVSVVPNDNFFSVSNFRYYAVRDGLPLRFTRAWEESPLGVDFAILKTGDQGPDFSTRKPDRIMERITAGDPPFERAFPVIGEFPLPDGSRGIVRQRRLIPVGGVSAGEVAKRFEAAVDRFLAPYSRDVEGLRVRLAYDPPALLEGRVGRVDVEAGRALVGEFSRNRPSLRLSNIRLAMEGLVFNPHRLLAEGAIEPLDLGRLVVGRLEISEEDLRTFLATRKNLRGLRLHLEDGAVSVVLRQPGPDVAGRLTILSPVPGGGPFRLEVDHLTLGGLPLPRTLVDWIFRHYDPAPKLARLPLAVELGAVRVRPGQIEIGDLDGTPPLRLK